jgi:hypothetical protein
LLHLILRRFTMTSFMIVSYKAAGAIARPRLLQL